MKTSSFFVWQFMFLLSVQVLSGQDSGDTTFIRKFGIGLHFEHNRSPYTYYYTGDINLDKVVFSISPSARFRLEPELGFRFLNEDSFDRKHLGLMAGTGIFKMHQLEKTNIYGGLRVEFSYNSDDYLEYSGMQSNIITEKTLILGVGPAAGAEYIFSPHFSLGGEIGIKYMRISENKPDDARMDFISVNAGVLVRYYK